MKQTKLNSEYLERLHRPEDIDHLIKTAVLLDITYDTETIGLDRKFTRLTQYAAVVSDIAGRIIKSMDVRIKIPEYFVIAPQAAVLTQADPKDIHYGIDRDPPHIAVGKIAYFFRNVYQSLWDQLEHTSEFVEIRVKNDPIRAIHDDTNYRTKSEEVRTYIIVDKDDVVHTFRLHDGGNQLSYRLTDETIPDSTRRYRDADGTRWQKVFPRTLSNGFNNIRADDSWIMMAAFTSGVADTIIPYLKENHLFRVDTRTLAKAAAAFNTHGEKGFQPGRALSPQSGQPYVGFGLGALMRSNTHLAAQARGLQDGIRMPDMSLHDDRFGHISALYDVLATKSLWAYIRLQDPEIARQIDLNTDQDKLKNFIMGSETFALRPLRTFLRDNFPDMPLVQIGVCVDINEEYDKRPQAILIRTDMDSLLADYMYKGQKLLDMEVADLHLMLQEQKGKAEAIFEILDLRKTPAVFEGAMAFERGLASNPDRHQTNRIFVQSNADFRARVIEAHNEFVKSYEDDIDPQTTRMEEEATTHFAKLEKAVILPSGMSINVPDDIHTHATVTFEKGQNIDYTLHKLLEPDPIEWAQSFSEDRRREVWEDFCEKVKNARKALQKYHSGIELPEPDEPYARSKKKRDDSDALGAHPQTWDRGPIPDDLLEKYTENAVEYLWKLRVCFLHAFEDYSKSYKVCDSYGHEIDFWELINMPDHIRSDRLKNGEYTIKFERLNYTSEVIMRMLETAPGRMSWYRGQLSKVSGGDSELAELEQWEHYQKAMAALHVNGPPDIDVDHHPWMSATKALKEIERIRGNFKSGLDIRADDDMIGLWDLFISDRPQAEAILDAVEKHCRAMLRKYPLTIERRRLMGYDPQSGQLIEKIKYPIAANASLLMLDVPDELLCKPLKHLEIGFNLIPIVEPEGLDLGHELATNNVTLLLRGHESGHICLAAHAQLAYGLKDEPYYTEIYSLAENRYIDSGMASPSKSKIVWLKVDRVPEEAPVSIRSVDNKLPSIKMTLVEDFEGTVSPILGRRSHMITAALIKDEGYTPKTGRTRLQGMKGAPLNKNAANDNLEENGWERETIVESVQTFTLKTFREAIKASLQREKIFSAKPMNNAELVLTHEDALRCGYHSLEDMRNKATHMFTDQDRAQDNPNNLLHLVAFRQVAKETTTYFDPKRRPVAGFIEPLSPIKREELWANPGKVVCL